MQCVYCDNTENLNTEFKIRFDEDVVIVQICDEHAEDATVKTVKEAYFKKMEKIDQLRQMAKELGYDITQSGKIATVAPLQRQEIRQAIKETVEPEIDMSEEGLVSTEIVDRGRELMSPIVEGAAVENFKPFSPKSLSKQLPEEALKGVAKIAAVEGRHGMVLSIPTKRVDKTGTTHISIKKTENDQTLQNRFKTHANQSMADQGHKFSSGYQVRELVCTICNGDCMIGSKTCPKCNGTGTITVN